MVNIKVNRGFLAEIRVKFVLKRRARERKAQYSNDIHDDYDNLRWNVCDDGDVISVWLIRFGTMHELLECACMCYVCMCTYIYIVVSTHK